MQITIIGATMYGMKQAVTLAEQGHQVLLTTAGSYPGEDLLGTFRAYTDLPAVQQIAAFTSHTGFKDPAHIKAALLTRLEEAGVQCAFYTRAVAPLLSHGQVCGILLATPNGLVTQPCSAVIDATGLQAHSFHLTGSCPVLKKGTSLPIRALFTGEPTEGNPLFDLFDAQRFHLLEEAILPEDMSPTAALTFAMERRSTLYRQIIAEGIRCDDVQPTLLDTQLTAPDPRLPGWLRRGEPLVLPETEPGAPDSVLLMGNPLPYDPDKGLEPIHAQAVAQPAQDVLVCGGGTAGIWSALAAAEQGVRTLVIERAPALGGTRTQAGVVGLYCGNRNGLFQDIWERIRNFTRQFPGKGIPNPVTEALFLSHETARLGVQVLLNTQIFHCTVENRRIAWVLCVGDDGIFAHRGKQTVDGTGEGLLCALAGCDVQVGDPQLQMTQNCSQWRRCLPARRPYSHHDQEVMLPTEDSEWQRSLSYILKHTDEYDLYPMLATRESRRIRGRNAVTLRSVARQQRWTDTVYDAYSVFDPHGRSFSPEGRLGALPALGQGRFAAVPLGALLPAQLDGVFITGKAISADQEGSNFLRMNPDVISIGWIVGLLAADCIKYSCDADRLNLAPLQEMLAQKLAIIAPAQDHQGITAATLLTRILSGEDESVFNEVVLARPDGLGDLLRRAGENKSFTKGVLLDMCRMVYGDTAGADRLTKLLAQLDDQNGKLVYTDRQRKTGVIIGGVHAEADDYWQINRLAVLLSQAQHKAAVPVILSVLKNTVPGGGWENNSSIYSAARLDSNTVPNYDRILCLAHGITQMPDECYLPELCRLMDEVAAIAPPQRPIWRDYLLLRLIFAATACGAEAEKLLHRAGLDVQHAIVRGAIEKLH